MIKTSQKHTSPNALRVHLNSNDKIVRQSSVSAIQVTSSQRNFVIQDPIGEQVTISLVIGNYTSIEEFVAMVLDVMQESLPGIADDIDIDIFEVSGSRRLSFVFPVSTLGYQINFVGVSNAAFNQLGFSGSQNYTATERGNIDAPLSPRFTTVTTSTSSQKGISFNVEGMINFMQNFDMDRPIYVQLESFISELTPSNRIFSLIWNELSSNGQFGSSQQMQKTLANVLINGNGDVMTSGSLGVAVLPSMILSKRTWTFQLLRCNGSEINVDSELRDFLMTLCFYQ